MVGLSASVMIVLALANAAALSLFTWVLIALRRLRLSPRLDSCTSLVPGDGTVSVVIAARNEAEDLRLCLQSILSQECVERVVLIDDHSHDQTQAIAASIATLNPRLTVLEAPDLPDGWVGKNHALDYGSRQVGTDYILFTDADVVMALGTVKAAVAVMDAGRLDLLSGHFFIHCKNISEQICAPVLAVSSSIALFGSALSLGAATGAFNMIRTTFYKMMGGHCSIKRCIVDDVSLARCAKAKGARTAFVYMADKTRVRLFRGFSGFVAAVRRSAVPYLKMKAVTALLGGVGLMLLGVATMVTVPLVLIDLVAREVTTSMLPFVLVGLAIVTYLTGSACVLESRRYHDGSVWWGFLYPLPLVLLAYGTSVAGVSVLLGCKLHWRGRNYEHR